MKKNKTNLILLGIFLISILGSCKHAVRKDENKNTITSGKYRVAIELVLDDISLTDSLLSQIKGVALDAYQWKNHLVLFGDPADTLGISEIIVHSGISLKTKIYSNPMYVFDKAVHCSNNTVEEKWNDYLLTANLVDDSLLQQEYINYHKIQFEEWPEVARGFCNADFQQLLVYRNGRQLLLVISIPADKTLDELNPKTVENNPRMDEWNQIMGKYQEGIEGTEPGEAWVFLNKLE